MIILIIILTVIAWLAAGVFSWIAIGLSDAYVDEDESAKFLRGCLCGGPIVLVIIVIISALYYINDHVIKKIASSSMDFFDREK